MLPRSGERHPHLKGVLLQVRRLSWRRLLPVKFTGGVLAIGAGLSLGREGPTVQMGAAVGQAVGQMLKVPRRSRSHLMSAGAGESGGFVQCPLSQVHPHHRGVAPRALAADLRHRADRRRRRLGYRRPVLDGPVAPPSIFPDIPCPI